jgi:hypothetical protein
MLPALASDSRSEASSCLALQPSGPTAVDPCSAALRLPLRHARPCAGHPRFVAADPAVVSRESMPSTSRRRSRTPSASVSSAHPRESGGPGVCGKCKQPSLDSRLRGNKRVEGPAPPVSSCPALCRASTSSLLPTRRTRVRESMPLNFAAAVQNSAALASPAPPRESGGPGVCGNTFAGFPLRAFCCLFRARSSPRKRGLGCRLSAKVDATRRRRDSLSPRGRGLCAL